MGNISSPTPITVLACSIEDLRQLIREEIPTPGESKIEIIDRAELCKRLDINPNTAIVWEKKGRIPSFRIGSAIRYNWPKVIEALESKKVSR